MPCSSVTLVLSALPLYTAIRTLPFSGVTDDAGSMVITEIFLMMVVVLK